MASKMTALAERLAAWAARLSETRWGSAALLGLLGAWFALFSGARPLLLPDEGRYVGVAWEMLRSGQWLTPTLNGLPYFHKPPLFYWLTALALHVFGLNEWAARLASLVGALVGAAAVYAFLRRHVSARAARLSALIMALQPLIFAGAGYANLDMLVAGLIGACVLALGHAVLSGSRIWLFWGYVFAALGFLAKGLIGFVLPGATIVLWLLCCRRFRDMKIFAFWPGWIAFLALTLPWPVLMQMKFPAFFHYFIVVQHFQRFDQTGFNNAHGWWFYPAILLVAFAPFAPVWLRSVQAAFRRGEGSSAPGARGAAMALFWVWAVVVTVFFSLPASKLVGYIFPAVFALSGAAAAALNGQNEDASAFSGSLKRHGVYGALALAALEVILAASLALVRPHDVRALAQPIGAQPAPVYAAGDYPFSLPFYAHLTAPVVIVDHWDAPDLAMHDNPRKELFDAGQFDADLAARTLVTPAQLPASLCAQRGGVWVVGKAADWPHPLPDALVAAKTAHLWRLDMADALVRQTQGCAP